MPRLGFLILFASIATTAHAGDLASCRTTLRHVVHNLRAMGPSDLADFSAAPMGTNPTVFARFPNETARLAFEQPFARMLNGPDGAAVSEALRDEARLLMQSETETAQRRDDVRHETRRGRIEPRFLQQFDGEIGEPTLFTSDGRPFVAFGHGTGAVRTLDLKSFTSVDHPIEGTVRTAPVVFEQDGRRWLAVVRAYAHPHLHGLRVFAMDGSGPSPKIKAEDHPNANTSLVLARDNGERWLATYSGDGGIPTLIPLDRPEAGPRTHPQKQRVGGFDSQIKIHSGREEALALFPTQTGYVVANVRDGAFTHWDYGSMVQATHFFDHDGAPAVFYADHHNAYTRDLQGGPAREITLNNPEETRVSIDTISAFGTSALFLTVGDSAQYRYLHHADLRTAASQLVAKVPHSARRAHLINYQSSRYAIWHSAQEISIMDLDFPRRVVTKNWQNTVIHRLHLVQTEDGIFGFANLLHNAPGYAIQLVSPAIQEPR